MVNQTPEKTETKEKKEEEEVKEEEKPLLVKVWDTLFYEGINAKGVMFWAKGFLRKGLDLQLIDAVIYDPKAKKDQWRYEGSYIVEGPVIVHTIIK